MKHKAIAWHIARFSVDKLEWVWRLLQLVGVDVCLSGVDKIMLMDKILTLHGVKEINDK